MDIDITKIILALIAIIAGIAIVIRITVTRNRQKIVQKNIRAGGDVAGRDMKK
jgi:hypothetical protein